MVDNCYCVSPGTIYVHAHYTYKEYNVYMEEKKKKKKKGRIGYVLGERNKFLPGPDGTPIWAPINLPPKTRAYKCLDILGNKLIAGK